MTSLSYEEIFSDFLGSVTDYDFTSIDIDNAYGLMTEYLHKTLSQSYIRRLFSSLSMDDIIQTMSFEMKHEVDESTDLDFVRNILSKGMVVEWLKPQVRSKLNLAQFMGGKEQKWFSQAQHLSELRGLLEDTELELRKSIRDRGYIYNSYLEES